jgi:hypothetical protein
MLDAINNELKIGDKVYFPSYNISTYVTTIEGNECVLDELGIRVVRNKIIKIKNPTTEELPIEIGDEVVFDRNLPFPFFGNVSSFIDGNPVVDVTYKCVSYSVIKENRGKYGAVILSANNYLRTGYGLKTKLSIVKSTK